MQTIPQTYQQAGYSMQLVKRERHAAMYSAKDAGYWEVHAVRVAKPKEIFGKAYPEREVLAGSNDFGRFGWACTSQERADVRFAHVLANPCVDVPST